MVVSVVESSNKNRYYNVPMLYYDCIRRKYDYNQTVVYKSNSSSSIRRRQQQQQQPTSTKAVTTEETTTTTSFLNPPTASVQVLSSIPSFPPPSTLASSSSAIDTVCDTSNPPLPTQQQPDLLLQKYQTITTPKQTIVVKEVRCDDKDFEVFVRNSDHCDRDDANNSSNHDNNDLHPRASSDEYKNTTVQEDLCDVCVHVPSLLCQRQKQEMEKRGVEVDKLDVEGIHKLEKDCCCCCSSSSTSSSCTLHHPLKMDQTICVTLPDSSCTSSKRTTTSCCCVSRDSSANRTSCCVSVLSSTVDEEFYFDYHHTLNKTQDVPYLPIPSTIHIPKSSSPSSFFCKKHTIPFFMQNKTKMITKDYDCIPSNDTTNTMSSNNGMNKMNFESNDQNVLHDLTEICMDDDDECCCDNNDDDDLMFDPVEPYVYPKQQQMIVVDDPKIVNTNDSNLDSIATLLYKQLVRVHDHIHNHHESTTMEQQQFKQEKNHDPDHGCVMNSQSFNLLINENETTTAADTSPPPTTNDLLQTLFAMIHRYPIVCQMKFQLFYSLKHQHRLLHESSNSSSSSWYDEDDYHYRYEYPGPIHLLTYFCSIRCLQGIQLTYQYYPEAIGYSDCYIGTPLHYTIHYYWQYHRCHHQNHNHHPGCSSNDDYNNNTKNDAQSNLAITMNQTIPITSSTQSSTATTSNTQVALVSLGYHDSIVIVVQYMLDQYPLGAKLKNYRTIEHRTPLHLACCYYGYDNKRITNQTPHNDDDRQRYHCYHHQNIHHNNKDDYYPLNAMYQVIELLVRHNPNAIQMYDQSRGMTPFHYVCMWPDFSPTHHRGTTSTNQSRHCTYSHRILQLFLHLCPGVIRLPVRQAGATNTTSKKKTKKKKMLPIVAYSDLDDNDEEEDEDDDDSMVQSKPLHIAARYGTGFIPLLLEHDRSQCHWTDQHFRLPLHHAIIAYGRLVVHDITNSMEQQSSQKARSRTKVCTTNEQINILKQNIQLLIESDPTTCFVTDDKDETPFQLALRLQCSKNILDLFRTMAT